MNVTIYHRIDRSMFWSFEDAVKFGDTPAIRAAYSYDAPDTIDADEALALAWRANNRVDGSPVEVIPDGRRSLCVGDVIAFGESAWQVKSVGFAPIGTGDLVAALTADGRPELAMDY